MTSQKRKREKDQSFFMYYTLMCVCVLCVRKLDAAFYLILCVHTCVLWACPCHNIHLEVRGQLAGDSSLCPLYGSRGLNSGHQAWQRLYTLHCLAGPKETKISEFGKEKFANVL